jgi:hypothetical protein
MTTAMTMRRQAASLLLATALVGCGGSSSTTVSASGGTGGHAADGSSGGTGANPNSGGNVAMAGAENAFCVPGAIRIVGGVTFTCQASGEWAPARECMMAVDATSCCSELVPARSVDVATDPCLVPYPLAPGNDGTECARAPSCDGVECGAPTWLVTRRAEKDASGRCVAMRECTYNGECRLGYDHRFCCACRDAFPPDYLNERCITSGPDAPKGCAECGNVSCAPCPSPATERCVLGRCAAPSGCGMLEIMLSGDRTNEADCIDPGFYWDGAACRAVGRLCHCEGADCGSLYQTAEACLTPYAHCGAVCVTGVGMTCNDDPTATLVSGRCENGSICSCNQGFTLNPATGRCR